MNWILKNKNKSSKALLVALFLVFAYFNFIPKIASAASCRSDQVTLPNGTCGCDTANGKILRSDGYCGYKTVLNGEAGAYTGEYVTPIDPKTGSVVEGGIPAKGSTNETEAYKKAYNLTCTDDSPLICTFKELLVGVLNVVGWLFSIAATLFAWVVEPANISGEGTGILQKQAVKDVWIMVRDLLNMTFILILLFAAFCTIFQVEKWNLKKVWLNILINALLVNFSYPIARFFIDVSNVAFYYFINNLFTSASGAVTGSGIFAMFGAASGIGEILKPESYANYEVAYLITMIVMLFIMGMTLLIIAALFVVRLVALTMLVMFSPVGFVGYIFPTTASFADKWWKNLFSYSFFAPIMIFGMAIALKITEAIGKESMRSFKLAASNNAPTDQTSFIANAAFMVIPIVVLWSTIGVAKSMGIEGADKVVDNVKKGGKWLANAPGKYSGVYGATKKVTEDFNKKGKLFGMKVPLMGNEGREAREAAMAGFVTGGVGGYKDARRNVEDKKIAEQMKEYKDRNYTADQIAEDLDPKKGKVVQMAAMRALMAEKGALGADPNRMIMALNIAGNDMALRNKIIDSADNFAGNDEFKASHINTLLASATAGLDVSDPKQKAAKDAIEGKIKSKIRKENVKKFIDHEIAISKNVTDAYRDNLESLNAEDFGKQKGLHEKIGTDTDLQDYILNHVSLDNGFHQEMFKNMKKGNRAEYISNHLHP
ncbi:MAG: hypothetical protein US57_C0004G0026 [Candidatus Moranbacteria bacterium GW2011_GWC2_37_73]|nr:MAG: hypothetical protein UR95_C0002G0074 [Parcubacteria group bacterium GW2011_GWC1_36_108]KKQ01083.1 MAG: hypothetical protein US09_C0003G0083 [Candidatus Moranbacteria bacterium GW2011_GWD1_36_198]KKQ02485.1 MAG: hypothetical protein US10_C0001G0083 [Candidatus Moranbacteria bacterium GW2011_GWD2_36_198]KKQ40143.1 MAG: hypothetical protein US57_C0004G0026 [Candidatus Moranbacteria bacterium GW2011_GWC2_37_73]HAS00237.1 hypothetical protein [Candidatus Moranbacteria bacterium]